MHLKAAGALLSAVIAAPLPVAASAVTIRFDNVWAIGGDHAESGFYISGLSLTGGYCPSGNPNCGYLNNARDTSFRTTIFMPNDGTFILDSVDFRLLDDEDDTSFVITEWGNDFEQYFVWCPGLRQGNQSCRFGRRPRRSHLAGLYIKGQRSSLFWQFGYHNNQAELACFPSAGPGGGFPAAERPWWPRLPVTPPEIIDICDAHPVMPGRAQGKPVLLLP